MDLIVGSQGFIGQNYTTYIRDIGVEHIVISTGEELSHFVREAKEYDFSEISNVIWLAGKSTPFNTRSKSDSRYSYDIDNLQNVLDLFYVNKWQGRLIFLSSGGCVYGDSTLPLSETSKIYPNNVYGQLKIYQEQMIRSSRLMHTILRVSNVFGPRNEVTPGRDIIGNWINCFKQDIPCKIFGDLESFRDFINVKDLTRAIHMSTERSDLSQTLNVGSGIRTKLEDLVQMFLECTSRKVRFDTRQARSVDRKGYVLDVSLAKNNIGWAPLYSTKSDILNFICKELNN